MGSSELLIALDRESATPLQQQVCDQVTLLVRSGQLRAGDVVPASRELALQLGVSRTVVMRAYELLRANAILTARRGSGTRVAGTAGVTGGAAAPGRPVVPAALAPQPPRSTADGDALWQPWEPAPAHHPGAGIDFRHGTPALADFPVTRWLQSLQEAYGRADAAALGYGPAEGAPALRTEIATLVRQSRALDASADRIMVTGGATQAMDILVRLLVGPGDVVVIEDPSHTVLRQIFGCSRAAVVPVPVDEQGLRVGDIDARVRAHGHDPARVKLVYVTPSHQFPTGFIMSEGRRTALLEWAHRSGATVLEDDYHNEFTFTAERLPALAAARHRDTVVYVGSFSKTLFPALRIGYAVLPPHLVQPFLGIKWITDRLTPTVGQDALAHFISTGGYLRHISRMTRLYRKRRSRLIEALLEHFGSEVRISGEAAGLHVLVTLTGTRGAGEGEIARLAAGRGVRIYPASGYFVQELPAEPTFLMGYAALTTARITEGVALLADVVREVRSRPGKAG
ncbi:PLP-dependent aminotransferase family protein [Streptomyces sp. NBC_01754]|uniref:MocR-like pyridoxine biosynthesis transcription factor PdxR n=1 Tax=Streptomyces sp. NBC_01754 TaxID=2975930 RepID=UPI002DD8CB96|nr:PLP-dependent aminotransferase family protein [Streptomyces sp. NBC_01754]WSC93606.1 PLP-dependent aminotransferase family protein [Streptomyces sp. NBC_01754]